MTAQHRSMTQRSHSCQTEFTQPEKGDLIQEANFDLIAEDLTTVDLITDADTESEADP